MNLTVSNEKFYDEILLIVKLFFSEEEIENLDINFNINYSFKNSTISGISFFVIFLYW